jgi:hypothetical protein
VRISAPLGFFLAGLPCFILLFVFPRATEPLAILGGFLLDASYFLVLLDNWKRKAPINAGLVKFEEKPFTYKANFGCMALFGLLFLLGLVGAMFSYLMRVDAGEKSSWYPPFR